MNRSSFRVIDGAAAPGPGTIAAIYARKSTEQDVDEEAKSVTRQVEHGRALAAQHGWIVHDELVFVDDGISGAEFTRRPGFLQLMGSLKPAPPFQVLIMSEESRLGRESIQTTGALFKLIAAGVRVFCYLGGGYERRLETATEKAMFALQSHADEMETERAQQRAFDAAIRKARAGYATGGPIYGYDLERVFAPNGARSHTEYRINRDQAAIVLQIFTRAAAGSGYQRIARELNDAGVKPSRGRQWSPNSIRGIAMRTMYRGQMEWNKSSGGVKFGTAKKRARPASDWITVPVPQLRLVDDVLWYAVQERRHRVTEKLVAASAKFGRGGQRRDGDSRYLLTGFARCSVCDGPVCVISRPLSERRIGPARGKRIRVIDHAAGRLVAYGCLRYQRRGVRFCTNANTVPVDLVEAAVLEALAAVLVKSARPKRILSLVREERAGSAPKLERMQRDLARLEAECRRGADALLAGGNLPMLLEALRDREARAGMLRSQLTAAASRSTGGVDGAALERLILAELKSAQAALTGRGMPAAREFLKKWLRGSIVLTPVAHPTRRDGRAFDFAGVLDLRPFGGAVAAFPHSGVSPTGSADMWGASFRGLVRAA